MLRLMCRDEEKVFCSTTKKRARILSFHASVNARGRDARSANNNFTGNIISVIIIVRRQVRRAAKNISPPLLTNKCKNDSQQGRNRKPHSHVELQHLKKINCKESREKRVEKNV